MARPPISDEELIARYGPHLNETPPGGWDAGIEPDRTVKTHCCFCGQQCGIQLKVRDNEVIGFEPWEEFPFNRGMLCPKCRRALFGLAQGALWRERLNERVSESSVSGPASMK